MPSSPTKRRTISYFRARWAHSPGITLAVAVARCLQTLATRAGTRIQLQDMQAEVRHRKHGKGDTWVSLHLAVWTRGQPASIVPHGSGNLEADLDASTPDQTFDYLDGDGMVLIAENHCFLMPSGVPQKHLEFYLRFLLSHGRGEGAEIPLHTEKFELLAVADETVIQQIRQQGVKKIHLHVGQYLETSKQYAVDHPTIIQKIGRAILDNLVEDEKTQSEIEAAANVQVRLVISCDTRYKGQLRPDDLTSIAQKIAREDDEAIEIETGTGQRIKRGQVVRKRPVDIVGFGKTVDHEDAWRKMVEYYLDLRNGGMLDQ